MRLNWLTLASTGMSRRSSQEPASQFWGKRKPTSLAGVFLISLLHWGSIHMCTSEWATSGSIKASRSSNAAQPGSSIDPALPIPAWQRGKGGAQWRRRCHLADSAFFSQYRSEHCGRLVCATTFAFDSNRAVILLHRRLLQQRLRRLSKYLFLPSKKNRPVLCWLLDGHFPSLF
jgi:hypothetical protein